MNPSGQCDLLGRIVMNDDGTVELGVIRAVLYDDFITQFKLDLTPHVLRSTKVYYEKPDGIVRSTDIRILRLKPLT